MARLTNGVYHYEVVLPPIEYLKVETKLSYSRHARDRIDFKLQNVSLPSKIVFKDSFLVEVEIINDKIVKGVFRVPYDSEFDIVLVVHPDGFVRTWWLNYVVDTHKTLERSNYVPKLLDSRKLFF